jgi:general secretion pathway protein L
VSTLRSFVLWWAGRMAEFLPARLRHADGAVGDALLVDLEPAALGLTLRRGGRETQLGRLALAAPTPAALDALLPRQVPAETLLRLPAHMLLEREAALPLAAERDLDRVLGYEMDRFTPFSAADVHWARGPVRRDRVKGQIWFRLSVVPKLALASALEALRAAGRAPDGLLVPAGDAVRRIDLTAAQPATLRRRAVAVAAGACAVLVLVAVALPIASQARALARVEARIERLRPAIAEVDGLRRRLAATTAGSDALAAEETRLGCVLCTIALLTDLLPDDTFLTAMSIRQRQVTLSGQSGDAARLIPLLSGEGALGEVAFLAPVTRTGPNRAEQFSLRLVAAP